jgi:pimeloyl-ACP methyl ester carboxylesterase
MLKFIKNPQMPPQKPKSASKKSAPQPAKGRNPFLIPSGAEDVSPLWLVKSIAAIVGLSLVCGYLTLCVYFYMGQSQLVLHPGHTTKLSALGETLHFAPDDSAIPQLTGHWIPADSGARYSSLTLLCLPSGDGSLADLDPTLQTLHSLGLNLFAFDYRGYGQSAPHHPSQQNMTQDAASAWQYLAVSRGIPANQILVYGTGVGASLAIQLATQHPEIAALILESPKGDLLSDILRDPRGNGVPVRLLFHDRFPLAVPLSTLKTPKLLVSYGPTGHAPQVFRTAADPKTTVELTSEGTTQSANDIRAIYLQSLNRFLDQYLPHQTQQLLPSPKP